MALAGRAGEDDVARRATPARQGHPQAFDHDRDAAQIIGRAPTVDAPVVDHAGEGIALPALDTRYRLAIGMGEEDQAASPTLPLEACDDAFSLARIDRARAGELADHRHIAGSIAPGPDGAAKSSSLGRDELLHRRLAAALRTNQSLQECDRIHQIATRACRRLSRRMMLNVV